MTTERKCAWFALCDNVATLERTHPVLGQVPICRRCNDKVELIGAENPQVKQWEFNARDIGHMHAAHAATWAVDGNTPQEHIRNVLTMLDEGDPQVYEYLPRRPDLSGEWADDYTVAALLEEATGRMPENITEEDREAVVNAWEAAVSETFEQACEAELRKAVA